MGKANFTERAWELLGESRGGWVESTDAPEEVTAKLTAARKPNAKQITKQATKPALKTQLDDLQNNAEEVNGTAGNSDTSGI